MPRHDPLATLRQMRDYAREAIQMVRGRARADLDADRMLSLPLTRLLEVLREAANRIPPKQHSAYPGIPWRRLIGLRNRLIHDYDRVDLSILWEIVTRDLPALVGELDTILAPE